MNNRGESAMSKTSSNQLKIKRQLFIKKALEKMSGKELPTAAEMAKVQNSPTDKSNWHRIFNGETREPRYKIISFLANYLGIKVERVWDVLQAANQIEENTDENNLLNHLIPIFNIPKNMPSDSINFVGREEELDKLKSELWKQEHKIIGIIGFPGTGKTTLISKFVRKLEQEKIDRFDTVVWTDIPPQVDNRRPPSIKQFITPILYDISNGKITSDTIRQDDLFGITERLLSQLRKQRCLIVIDNAEALLSDKNKKLGESGTFAEDCRDYYYLFNKILQTEHCSKLIINSRESFVKLRSLNYSEFTLRGLDQKYAIELISHLSKKYEVENSVYKLQETDIDLITLIKKCSGNPKAIEIVIPHILADKEFQGNVNLFLKQNKPIDGIDGLSTILKEVVNKLNDKQRECLTRISVYQYRLSLKGIHSQMPRLYEHEIILIIHDLKVANLLKAENQFQDKNSSIYRIHPFIKEYCYRLLDQNMLNESHVRAANYYLNQAGNCQEVQEVDAAFEAIHHFYKIGMFNDCYEIFIFNILNATRLDNLRCSANLWNNVDRIIELAPKLISKLSDLEKKAITLVPLGFVYSEAGKNLKALEVSDEILKITDRQLNKDEELIFPKIAAYINKGRAHRLIGNFKQSQQDCEIASKYAKKLGKKSWQALAIYELGLIHLELKKPRRAIGCFITAAFQAIEEKVVPRGVHSFKKLLSGEKLKEGAEEEIEKTIGKYESEDNSQDDTRKFRILYNIARALNLLELHTPSEFILKIAERFVNEKTDMGNPIWLYTELATCYGKKHKAEEYLKKAYSRKETAPMICNAFTLYKYAEWEYSWEHYQDALEKYKELEKLLREAEFPLWQIKAHDGLANYYDTFYSQPNVNVSPSECKTNAAKQREKAEEIRKQWNLPEEES